MRSHEVDNHLPSDTTIHVEARKGASTHRRWRVLALSIAVTLLLGGGIAVYRGLAGTPGEATDISAGSTSQYPNGRIPMSALTEIEEGFHLLPEAASSYLELIDALESAGHTATLNSAYRSLEEQQELIDDFGLLEDGGTAAQVGESEHGDGIAVDLTLNAEALEWMRSHAGEFGFTETIASEPWHWAYTG